MVAGRRARGIQGLVAGVGMAVSALAGAAPQSSRVPDPMLPPAVKLALQRAQIPESALTVVIEEAGSGRRVLAWNEQQPVNPASLAKLITTYAALDRLGPAWRWRTPVWLTGPLHDGVLNGSLVIRGSGDPTLVLERVWLLLRRVQQLGVREIRGDIVLDRSAFAVPERDPGEFDGEPLRPYNTQPDALLLNYKSVVYGFVPDTATDRVRVTRTPLLDGATPELSLPLMAGPCNDWRAALKASFEPGADARFAGAYPAACGERDWPVADPQPVTYNARLILGLWQQMGGRLNGNVREGTAPTDRPPSFEVTSPALAEVVRDINKFSNNVMAQQLFLTLALADAGSHPGPATPARSRAWVLDWLARHAGAQVADVVLDNGAGLSRDARLPAALLARLLQQAWSSPVMPELMASLPVSALDGTLRRADMPAGRAHLKTGSLRDVTGLAGYVLSNSGRRYVLVAIVNHDHARAARPALDALTRWAADDAPAR